MAHVKAAGSTRMNRDSQPKNLGVKLSGGSKAKIGSIIVRQKGTQFRAGLNVRMGHDYTLYAAKDGIVEFFQKMGKKYINVVA